MKNSIKYLLICIAAISVLITLYGCTKTTKEPETIILDAVYKKEALLFKDSFYYTTGLDIHDNMIYLCGQMNGNICVAAIDQQSNTINYLPVEITSTATGFCKIKNGFVIISGIYNNKTHEAQQLLYIIAENGDIIQKTDISIYLDENYQTYLWSDEKNIFFTNNGKCVEVDIKTGVDKILYDISSIGTLINVTKINDSPALLIENQFGTHLLYCYEESRTFIENTTYNKDFIKTAEQVFILDDINFLIYNNLGIYKSDGDSTQIVLNWSNSGIKKENILSFAIINDNQFVMIYRENNNEPCLYYLNAANNNNDSSRTVVRVTYSETGAKIIPEAALQFNALSNKYYVLCNEVATVFNETEYASTAQLSELDKMILNGNAGDVIVFNSDYEKYIEKNIFMDLYKSMEDDADILKSDLFSCVLNSLEFDDRLFAITPCFRIKTLVGKESNLSNIINKTWNINSFIELYSTLSKNQQMTAVVNREYFTDIFLHYSAGTYIDFDNNSCDFINSNFINLLKFLNELPEQNKSIHGINNTMLYRNNTYLLYDTTLCNVADYLSLKVRFGIDENLNFIGYPSFNGGKEIVLPYDYYAISSESAVSDGAWEFIKFLLSENIILNSSNSKSYIPTYKKVFNEWAEIQQSYTYIIDDNSALYYAKIGSTNADPQINSFEITDMVVTEFFNYIESIKSDKTLPTAIYNIIIDETSRYFNNSITADEVAKVIQNRVSIYLAEQG